MDDRSDLIAKYFAYLVQEYGFHIERKEFDSQAMGNAVVVLKSSSIGIEIVVDRNQVLMSIGNLLDTRKQWFEFTDVVKYYAPSVDNVYIFPEKTHENTWDEIVESQLSRLATILRQYCEPLLIGKFWRKEEIEKIQENRKAELLRKLRKDT